MLITPQSIKLIDPPTEKQILHKIEIAGRVAYRSEDKITEESSVGFVAMILKRGHLSVIEHVSLTVEIDTNRGVTHELVRHRIASFTQESTRYCNYSSDGRVQMRFTDITHLMSSPEAVGVLLEHYRLCEQAYNRLISLGEKPQMARHALPIGLASRIVITANLREWLHIFDLRLSPAAHPVMREMMQLILDEFQKRYPIIFGGVK